MMRRPAKWRGVTVKTRCVSPQASYWRAMAARSPKAEAQITDGLLTLRLPKAESARPKKIKIAAK